MLVLDLDPNLVLLMGLPTTLGVNQLKATVPRATLVLALHPCLLSLG